MCGDPPNIIIGTSLGYSFADFITNTGVIAGFSLILVILYFFFCFRRELEKSVAERGEVSYPNPKDAIENRKDFAVSSAIFAAAVVLLVTHAQTGLNRGGHRRFHRRGDACNGGKGRSVASEKSGL